MNSHFYHSKMDKVIQISRAVDIMIVSKVLVQVVIVSGISSYASQCGLADWQKDSYESLTSVAGKFREKKGIVIQDIFAEMLNLVQKIKWIFIMDLL